MFFYVLVCFKQVKSVLKYLYPVPKDDSRRVITFANQEDYISFRSVIQCVLFLLWGSFLGGFLVGERCSASLCLT